MAKAIIMPALGVAQETGIIVQWFKREGDTVVKGEPLMEIETDKVTVEIEAPESGVLTDVTAGPGDEIPVGETVGRIVSSEEAQSRQTLDGAVKRKATPVATRLAAAHGIDLQSVQGSNDRITKADVQDFLNQDDDVKPALLPASPKARRLAEESGVPLAEIAGSGPNGAILADDVVAAEEMHRPAAVSQQDPPMTVRDDGQVVDLTRAWRVMANRTTASWRNAPHFFLLREVDGSRLRQWRESVNQQSTAKTTYTDLLVKLVAAALRRHPRLNGRWQDETVILNAEINICLAVAVEDALITPVIQRADTLSLAELAEQRLDLVERAHAGTLRPDDLHGGTFTISNLGMYGIDAFTAIINQPQAAILAVGRLADRVVPVDGVPAVRPQMTLSLSCDHRVVDGAGGAQFLNTLTNLIEEPLHLIA